MKERPKLFRDVNGYPCLSLPLSDMLNAMDDNERRIVLGYALLDGEFLRVLCGHIATPDQELTDPPAHDGWLDSESRARAREALAPLLGEAVREELRLAREEAARCRNGRDLCRSLVLVRDLMRRENFSVEASISRRKQMDEIWRDAVKWYNADSKAVGINEQIGNSHAETD
jgi:hypothetical protein